MSSVIKNYMNITWEKFDVCSKLFKITFKFGSSGCRLTLGSFVSVVLHKSLKISYEKSYGVGLQHLLHEKSYEKSHENLLKPKMFNKKSY